MKKPIVLMSLILLMCAGCKYFKKPSAKSVDTISADTMASSQEIDSSAYYGDLENQTVSNESTPSFQSNAVSGKYYMIVGCFTVPTNADRYAEKIRNMGYESQIITGNGNFQMVSARLYNSYRESVNEIDKFRTEVTPNAWVYRQR